MDTPIVAAIVTSSVSLAAAGINIAVTMSQLRTRHRQEGFRTILAPLMPELGVAIHQVMACCKVVVHRLKDGGGTESWMRRADKQSHRLRELRRQLLFPLAGLESAIKQIALLPDFIRHLESDPIRCEKLYELAEQLRAALHMAYWTRMYEEMCLLAGALR